MDEDSEDLSSLSLSTVSPSPDRNHGHQEDSNRGDQKDTPQGQDVNSETPTFNIVVKEEEDWELDNTGGSLEPG
ncbi:hypothetical protein J4Q44_G00291860 [Coregonus suidteri]|uniref:Uncharacterized protein n=1 Tax=Coregonus suidteri TaxID=861788 RepID=A0AAN8KZU7_9TELE